MSTPLRTEARAVAVPAHKASNISTRRSYIFSRSARRMHSRSISIIVESHSSSARASASPRILSFSFISAQSRLSSSGRRPASSTRRRWSGASLRSSRSLSPISSLNTTAVDSARIETIPLEASLGTAVNVVVKTTVLSPTWMVKGAASASWIATERPGTKGDPDGCMIHVHFARETSAISIRAGDVRPRCNR